MAKPWERNGNQISTGGKPWERNRTRPDPEFASSYEDEVVPEENGFWREVGDTAVSVGKGALGATKALTDVFGAENVASRGLKRGIGALDELQSDEQKQQRQMHAQRMAEAEATGSTWEEIKAAGRNFLDDPLDYAAEGAGSFLPYAPLGLIGGAAKVAGAAQSVNKARTVATIGMGSAQGVGAVKGSQYDAVYNELKKEGASDEEADARAMEHQGYNKGNTVNLLTGAAFGAGASLGIERIVSGAGLPSMVGKGLRKRAALGTAYEVLPEGVQGGQERYATNDALIREGFKLDPWTGVAGAATQEGLMAGPAGGLVAAAQGYTKTPGEIDAERIQQEQYVADMERAQVEADIQAEAQAREEDTAKRRQALRVQIGDDPGMSLATFEERFDEVNKARKLEEKALAIEAKDVWGKAIAATPSGGEMLDLKTFTKQYLAERGFTGEKVLLHDAYSDFLDRQVEQEEALDREIAGLTPLQPGTVRDVTKPSMIDLTSEQDRADYLARNRPDLLGDPSELRGIEGDWAGDELASAYAAEHGLPPPERSQAAVAPTGLVRDAGTIRRDELAAAHAERNGLPPTGISEPDQLGLTRNKRQMDFLGELDQTLSPDYAGEGGVTEAPPNPPGMYETPAPVTPAPVTPAAKAPKVVVPKAPKEPSVRETVNSEVDQALVDGLITKDQHADLKNGMTNPYGQITGKVTPWAKRTRKELAAAIQEKVENDTLEVERVDLAKMSEEDAFAKGYVRKTTYDAKGKETSQWVKPTVRAESTKPGRVNKFELDRNRTGVDIENEVDLADYFRSVIPVGNRDAVESYAESLNGDTPLGLRTIAEGYGIAHGTLNNALRTARAAVARAADNVGVSRVYALELAGLSAKKLGVDQDTVVSDAAAFGAGLRIKKRGDGSTVVRSESTDFDPTAGYERVELAEGEEAAPDVDPDVDGIAKDSDTSLILASDVASDAANDWNELKPGEFPRFGEMGPEVRAEWVQDYSDQLGTDDSAAGIEQAILQFADNLEKAHEGTIQRAFGNNADGSKRGDAEGKGPGKSRDVVQAGATGKNTGAVQAEGDAETEGSQADGTVTEAKPPAGQELKDLDDKVTELRKNIGEIRGKRLDKLLERFDKGEIDVDRLADELQTMKEQSAPAANVDSLRPMLETIDAKPGANIVRMAKLLGPKLYGSPMDLTTVSVKELFQNSFDAIKALIDNGTIKNGEIAITTNSAKRTVTLIDNGSGMSPSVLANQFLQIAGTMKETDRASGGLGIAKMLFLYGNERLSVSTMRDGKVATLDTSGVELMAALEGGPSPKIDIHSPSADESEMFPSGQGTRIEIKVPESFVDASTGETQRIEFPTLVGYYKVLKLSPLFSDISVKFNGDPVPIGNRFRADDYTQFANVTFDWGTARIYVTKDIEKSWGDNTHVLSNGLWQFSTTITDGSGGWGAKALPRKFYVDISPTVRPEDFGYPFDLNRQQFSKTADEEINKIFLYITALYRNDSLIDQAQDFGSVEYLDRNGAGSVESTESKRLSPPIDQNAGPMAAITAGDTVTVHEGRLVVNGRAIPELKPEDLATTSIDLDKVMIDQSEIDPYRVMLHDNLLVNDNAGGADLVPISEAARAKFGVRFDDYVFGIGDAFRELRDFTASMMGYDDLRNEAVGVSFDKEYRGVSIKIPFAGMFINPAVPEYTDVRRAALGMVSTMVHELAHFRVRTHDASFAAEMQRILVDLDAQDEFNVAAFKLRVIGIVNKHHDIMLWLHERTSDENSKARGRRFQDGARQTRLGGDAGDVAGLGQTTGQGQGVVGRAEQGSYSRQEGTNAESGSGGSIPGGDKLSQPGAVRGKPRFSVAPTTKSIQDKINGWNAPDSVKDAAFKTVTNLATLAKRSTYFMALGNDLADIVAGILPSARKYFDIIGAKGSIKLNHEAKVNAIATRAYKVTDKTDLNRFLKFSTSKAKWGFQPDWLEAGVTVEIDDGARKQFAALTPAAQDSAREIFKHGHESRNELRRLVKVEIEDGFDTENKTSSPSERKSIERRRMKAMRMFEKDLPMMQTPYAPLSRFGNYVMVAKSQMWLDAEARNDHKFLEDNRSSGQHYVVSFHDNSGLAALAARDMRSTGWPSVEHSAKEVFAQGITEAPWSAMRRLRTMVDSHYGSNEPGDMKAAASARKNINTMLSDLYLATLAETSARKHNMKRENVEGASDDMLRAFASKGNSDAHFMAALAKNGEVTSVLAEMRDQAGKPSKPGDERADRKLALNEILTRHALGLAYVETPIQDKLMQFNSVWTLLTKPSYFFQNAMQPWMMSLPMIARHKNVSMAKAAAELTRAYSQLSPAFGKAGFIKAMFNGEFDIDALPLPADEKAMLKRQLELGILNVGINRDMGYWESRGGMSQPLVDGLHKMNGWVKQIETINRVTTALAAYRVVGGGEAGVKEATHILNTTHGNYSGGNASRLWSLPGAKLILQFRTFQFVQASLMIRLFVGTKFGSKEEKAASWAALRWTLGHFAIMSGVNGLPAMSLIGWMLAAALGDDDEPVDFDKMVRDAIKDETTADLLLKGAPSLIGLDLTGQLGAQNMLSILPYTDIDLNDRTGYAKTMLGLSGSFIGGTMSNMFDGVGLIQQGDLYKGFEKMLPSGISKAANAWRMASDGYTNRNGDLLMDSSEFAGLGLLAQGMGFRTGMVAKIQDGTGRAIKFDRLYSDQSSEITHRYVKAYRSGDASEMTAQRQAFTDLQASRRANGFKVQPLSNLLKAPREQMKRERNTIGGVQFNKNNREFVEDLVAED